MTRTVSALDDLVGFEVVDGLEAVRQRVAQRLRFTLGEWFLDAEAGIPYLERLAGGGGDHIQLFAQIVATETLAVEGVIAVTVESADLDKTTRRLQLVMTIETDDGVVTVEEAV